MNSLTNPLLSLEGAEIRDELGTVQTVGKMLANVLARAQSADAVRAMMVAMQIHSNKSVDLEEADYALILHVDARDSVAGSWKDE